MRQWFGLAAVGNLQQGSLQPSQGLGKPARAHVADRGHDEDDERREPGKQEPRVADCRIELRAIEFDGDIDRID
jgi:hypothetical protein